MNFNDIQTLIDSLQKRPNPTHLEDILRAQNWFSELNKPAQKQLLINQQWTERIEQINKSLNYGNHLINFTKSFEVRYDNSYLDFIKQIDKVSNVDYSHKILNSFIFHKYDFADLINGYEDEEIKVDENNTIVEEIETKQVILDETARIKQIIFEIYLNNEQLYKLQPREFEQLIAELLYNKGFEIELTRQTRDNGYDILAMKYINGFSPIKYLVECKKYAENRKIGVEIIRSFKEVLSTEQANKGLIVTTSYFSRDAIKKQQETPLLLEYKDKDEVINWVNEYYTQKNNF
ncbi:restriction endonuclease [Chryseobacterium sp. LC2016-27]|uniref:restriction endonuclease n=1 Tax=Chryseobacterium sp. LC2016-27 TaxID=2897326 RepID=UPI001E456F81|nr:restriction endonuclease [Chryseobacterium sp. LC2016-27]MCD0456789.1 restriction endonuclease [Chryseobacterium sp. LC2016-27]